MKFNKFDILFENVMDYIFESIMLDIDSLSLSDKDKQIIKSWPEQKKQKAAIFWINRNVSKDLKKIEQAFYLTKDFTSVNTTQKFDDLFKYDMSLDKHAKLSAKTVNVFEMTNSETGEKILTNPYDAGTGVVIYQVNDSKDGQKAIRIAADQSFGIDFNGWCIIARRSKFSEKVLKQFDKMSEESKMQMDFYSEDDLAVAWTKWKDYNVYPKRAAFKNGRLIAFSASEPRDNKYFEDQTVEWWDVNNKPYEDAMKVLGVEDDINFLKKYGKINLAKMKNCPPDIIEELTDSENVEVRMHIAERKKLSPELIEKLSNDEWDPVREKIAKRTDLSPELMTKLSLDKNTEVRMSIAARKHLPDEFIKKLANDKEYGVRGAIADRNDCPIELIEKLANDKDWYVRLRVAQREDLSKDLIEKLVKDKNEDVRSQIKETYFNH